MSARIWTCNNCNADNVFDRTMTERDPDMSFVKSLLGGDTHICLCAECGHFELVVLIGRLESRTTKSDSENLKSGTFSVPLQ